MPLCPSGSALPSLLCHRTIQREVEDLIALEDRRAGLQPVFVVQGRIQDERNLRLGHAAVRAQAVALQAGEVVVRQRGADAHIGRGNYRDVALAVGGQVVHATRGLAVENRLNAVDAADRVDDLLWGRLARAPDAHETTERAVVGNKSIGDRANYPY